MDQIESGELFQNRVPEDTVITVNYLCPTCDKFAKHSRLLHKLSRNERIRIGTTETLELCSREQLKSGYFNGCHLCGLLWVRAGGHLFDPEKPIITQEKVFIKLRARSFSREYEMETQGTSVQLLWWKVAAPFMYGTDSSRPLYKPVRLTNC